jgi:hypothetical protein
LDPDTSFGFCHDLFRVEDDGTETYLGCDEIAPEDVSFFRNLAWVPEEMNRLAALVDELRVRLKESGD